MLHHPASLSCSASLGAILLIAMTGSLAAQSWRQASPPAAPPARSSHAMATDLSSAQVILFGGFAGAAYLGDTWRYDGMTWTAVTGSGPPARARHAMAFDENRGRIVLFGGINGTGFNNWFGDTWEYGNGAWVQRSSSQFPPPRFGHAMAYDRVAARVLMFGGRSRSGPVFLGDTWQYDGTTWTPLTPATSPGARMGAAMALDPSSGHVLLSGGMPMGGGFAGETWTWNGSTWVLLAPVHAPSPRMDAVMAADVLGGRIVLYGGYDGTDLTDTFEWNGSDWRRLSSAVQPLVPVLPAMATGPSGRHVLLWGGEDSGAVPHAETWWNGQFAEVLAFGLGCGTPPLALAAAPGNTPMLGQTFHSELALVPAGVIAFQSLGFDDKSVLGQPLPLDLSMYQMPGCFLYHDAAALFLPCTVAGGIATHDLAVPNRPSFVGMTAFLQGYMLAPGSNPAGIVTSNALALTVGY